MFFFSSVLSSFHGFLIDLLNHTIFDLESFKSNTQHVNDKCLDDLNKFV